MFKEKVSDAREDNGGKNLVVVLLGYLYRKQVESLRLLPGFKS